MFQFLSAKIDVAPFLSGLTEIHCHVLPGIDDGAGDIEQAFELIKGFADLGYKKIIATPHIMQGTYPNTKETIQAAFDVMNKQWPSNLDHIECHFAAEHMIDQGLVSMIEEKQMLCLKENYVLVEMSYAQRPLELSERIYQMLLSGYQPVLAHPERYNFYSEKSHYQRLVEMGCLLQLNLLSLSSYYGEHVQKKAHLLLRENMFDFVGSDVHHFRHMQALSKLQIRSKQLGALKAIIDQTSEVFGS